MHGPCIAPGDDPPAGPRRTIDGGYVVINNLNVGQARRERSSYDMLMQLTPSICCGLDFISVF